jgi:hypothetical protein
VRASTLLAVFLAMPGAGFAQTNTDRSLTPAESSADGTNAAGATAPPTNAPPLEALSDLRTGSQAGPDLSGLTREQLELRMKSLSQNLASANAEAESFRERWEDLKLRDEALGVEALTVDDQKLEERVVEDMRQMYQTELKRREARQIIERLLSTTQELLRTAPHEDPKTRADYEVAVRGARDYLAGLEGASIPIGGSLADGKITDINPELNAVILNLGKTQGVKEGMPFVIYRDNAEIGTVKVVLARDLISAAVMVSVKPKEAFKVGDRATADVQE